MKLKKIIIYLILIMIIPIGAALYLDYKFQNKLTLKINISYHDFRSQGHLSTRPVTRAFSELYKDILMIEGIFKSYEPRSRIIETTHTKFIFDVIENTKIDEDKIKELIINRLDSINEIYVSIDKKLNNLCKEYQYRPDVCRPYFLRSLELEYPEFTKPKISLKASKGNDGIKIEIFKKFSKINTISLGLVFSVIIILLIEISIKRKLIFKKIKKLY